MQVDAHNIVPCWAASAKLDPQLDSKLNPIDPKIDPKIDLKLDPKLEISALLPHFLTPIPALQANPPGSLDSEKVDWKKVRDGLEIDRSVREVAWVRPGEQAAAEMLTSYIGKLTSCSEQVFCVF